MPAVDILMPFRNAGPWIAQAWESLRRQRFPDWRLIAVDDHSRDASAEVLVRAAEGDRRLTLVPGPGRGVAAALNRALEEVSAPVVARMDADDLCHPDRLEALMDALGRNPSWQAVGSRVRLFPVVRVSERMASYLRWQNRLVLPQQIARERYVECTVTHATLAVRTEALVAGGGWWEGDGPEDLDLLLRWHRLGYRVGKVPRVLYLWREHPGRETRRSARMGAGAFRAVKARHLAAELASRGIGHATVFGRGQTLAAWTRALGSRGLGVRGVEWKPGHAEVRWEGVALFCFGAAAVRDRVRRCVPAGVQEGQDYLFVA
ncbi:glycosyltransferase family 2 protein [Deferrisoma camini]|uniref:glycosyltransferase family 2 protein n=1 Tax=Deferrisoma camini TaxID=1035120 RepID=UPI00046CA688|nr:glycosyltransferase family 2 protein [Deferrisoma camini]